MPVGVTIASPSRPISSHRLRGHKRPGCPHLAWEGILEYLAEEHHWGANEEFQADDISSFRSLMSTPSEFKLCKYLSAKLSSVSIFDRPLSSFSSTISVGGTIVVFGSEQSCLLPTPTSPLPPPSRSPTPRRIYSFYCLNMIFIRLRILAREKPLTKPASLRGTLLEGSSAAPPLLVTLLWIFMSSFLSNLRRPFCPHGM
jgi:hypothetical protein